MISWSYTITPGIKITLHQIEEQKKIILLNPKPLSYMIKQQLQKNTERIHAALTLGEHHISKRELESILTSEKIAKVENEYVGKLGLSTKKILNSIPYDFEAYQRAITPKDIVKWQQIIEQKKKINEIKALNDLQQFFFNSHDHPVVQAGLWYCSILHLGNIVPHAQLFSSVSAYAILTAYHFHGSRLINLEQTWREEFDTYKDALTTSFTRNNYTAFLEYFARSVRQQLERIRTTVTVPIESSKDSIYLTQRQKEILAYCDEPNKHITNKIVQKMFNISQITASRELSILAQKGLLFSYGKGRSVYYVRS